MRQLGLLKSVVSRTGEMNPTIQPRRGDGVITWGKKIPIGDCEAQDVTIGKLHFRSIDFGDTVRLPERSRVALGNIGSSGKNQCVLLHAVAGTQWNREGKRNGVPTLARGLDEAEEWQKEEFAQAKNAMVATGNGGGEHLAEIRSAAHDAIKPGHGRDYRGFTLFYSELFKRNKISVMVFDLGGREGG